MIGEQHFSWSAFGSLALCQCHLHDSPPTGTAKPLNNQKCNEKVEVLIAFPLTTLSAIGYTEFLQVRFSAN